MNLSRRGFLAGLSAALAAAAAPVRAVARLMPDGFEEFTTYFYFTPGPAPDNWHCVTRIANIECDELGASTKEWLPGFSEPARTVDQHEPITRWGPEL